MVGSPVGAGLAVDGKGRFVVREERRRRGDRRGRRRCDRRQFAQVEAVEADAALAGAGAGRDHQFDARGAAQRTVAGRTPGELDLALPEAEGRPIGRHAVVVASAPPDVGAALVDQLHLQRVRRRVAAQSQGEFVARRVLDRQNAARRHIAGHAPEVEVDAEGPALLAVDAAQAGLHVVGRGDRPGRWIVEVVEHPVRHLLWRIRRLGLRLGRSGIAAASSNARAAASILIP